MQFRQHFPTSTMPMLKIEILAALPPNVNLGWDQESILGRGEDWVPEQAEYEDKFYNHT